jgi:hypothetical protein
MGRTGDWNERAHALAALIANLGVLPKQIRRGAAMPARNSVSVHAGCGDGGLRFLISPHGRSANHGHFATGGMDERIDSTLPPVLRPNTVPRSYSRLNST